MEQELMMLMQQGEQEVITKIIAQNAYTAQFGLVFTEEDAQKLVQTRRESLRKYGRVELGSSIMDALIYAFCDSPFLHPHNQMELLHELVETFYYFKNESLELWNDQEVIDHMKSQFDGPCHGSVELLQIRSMETLARRLRFGEEEETFCQEGEEKENV